MSAHADLDRELVGIVCHDLRTPLSAILVSAEMIARACLMTRATRRRCSAS